MNTYFLMKHPHIFYLNDLIPICSVIIVLGTLVISIKNLSFIKKQTSINSYNSFISNYKLYDELSKRKIDFISTSEIDRLVFPYFESLTFSNMYKNYVEILGGYSPPYLIEIGNNSLKEFQEVFLRFNHKIQSFINLIKNEIDQISKNQNLLHGQKSILIDLYSDFILSDYMNLSKELTSNPKLLECINNYPGNSLNFDIINFLSLYKELQERNV